MRKIVMAIAVFCFLSTQAQVEFQNISTSAGLDYQGRTFGSSWGDINGDGLVDLFLSCHQNKAEPLFENDSIRIYVNMGDGSFDDSIYSLDDGEQSDFHGGFFFDHDNDGDKDLIVVNGGTKKNIFLFNDGGTQLGDIADGVNLELNKSRGRQSMGVDVNNDGLTDIIVNNEDPYDPLGVGTVLNVASPGVAYQIDSLTFIEPFSLTSSISDLDGDDRTDVVVAADGLNIYAVDTDGVFTLENHLDIANITDMNVADFNGDLLPDIFLARGLTQESDIQQFNDSSIHASMKVSSTLAACQGWFKSPGNVQVLLSTNGVSEFDLHVGDSTTIPVNNMVEYVYSMVLDPTSADVQGFQSPGGSGGINCSFGYDTTDSLWHFKATSDLAPTRTIILTLNAEEPITQFEAMGTPEPGEDSRDLLLINQGGLQFMESADPAFLLVEYSVGATSGDFDNDGDNDIIVVSTGRAKNRKNHLYENLGGGSFTVHENGWGTQGDVAGIGDGITNGDFDNDGFLDLLQTNGSTKFFLDSAGIDLYRNLGNGNHWITVDLNGLESNADGFGATVLITAGGISQIANMTGGVHAASQDDGRIHFGLGSIDQVEEVRILWPSGTEDVIHDPAVDQILTVVEGDYLTIEVSDPWDVAGQDLQAMLNRGMIDHAVVYSTLGQQVTRIPQPRRELGADDLHLATGLYMLAYANEKGKVIAMRKVVVPN